MNIIELLFYIINYFVELPLNRSEQLQHEAKEWKASEIAKESKIGNLLVKGDAWYFQVLNALIAIFGVKLLSEWYYRPIDYSEDNQPPMPQQNAPFYNNQPPSKQRLF